MAKISKRLISKHNEALEILKQEKLSFDDKLFVFEHFHEGVNMSNNMISAHFTPYPLARQIHMCTAYHNFVDIGAGIGVFSFAMARQFEFDNHMQDKTLKGVAVERCQSYYEVGKKLVPEIHWICGDITDIEVIREIKEYMGETPFSVISNPPYGKMVKGINNDWLKYNGSRFEYKAIEIGALLGAYDGCFLIPQTSCPFRITNRSSGYVEDKAYQDREYKKFIKQTGLEISPNIGIPTDCNEAYQFKEVSIVTEFAIVEYHEYDYEPNDIRQRIKQRSDRYISPVTNKPLENRVPETDSKGQISLF